MNQMYIKRKTERTGLKILAIALFIFGIMTLFSAFATAGMVSNWIGDRSSLEMMVVAEFVLSGILFCISGAIPSFPSWDASVEFGDNILEIHSEGPRTGKIRINDRVFNAAYKTSRDTVKYDQPITIKKEALPQCYQQKIVGRGYVYALFHKLEDGHVLAVIYPTFDNSIVFIDDLAIVDNGYINQKNIDAIYNKPAPKEAATTVTAQAAPIPSAQVIPTTAPSMMETVPVTKKMLKATSGALAGRIWEVSDTPLTIGRNPQTSQVVFPETTKGASRTHCQVFTRNGKLFLKDCGATYGTKLSNGLTLINHMEVELNAGDSFTIGETEVFEIIK